MARKREHREEVRAWFLDCIEEMDVGNVENEGKWWVQSDFEAREGGGAVAGWIYWMMRLWRGW